MVLLTTSFWYQAALNAVAPLVTAVVGLLLVGLAINFITRGLQDRRAAKELKYTLISETTETASTLYNHITWYSQFRVGSARDVQGDDQEIAERLSLKNQYITGRAKAEVLEARLAAYFDEPRVAVAWHAVRDCLNVRYYQVLGIPDEQLAQVYNENAPGWDDRYHSGLGARYLSDRSTVFKAYSCHLRTTAKLIFACPLRPRRIAGRAKRNIDDVVNQAKIEIVEPTTGRSDEQEIQPTMERIKFDYKESEITASGDKAAGL